MEIGNQLGFYAFLSIIPLIIIYLTKPRPKDYVFPSLQFLLKTAGKAKRFTLFQTLTRNLLFLLQLLILLLLSAAVLEPVVTVAIDAAADSTVIVLDVSASMQAKHKGATRFVFANDVAKRSLSGTNSIILAKNTPLVALEKGSKSKAMDVLSTVKPKATSSNLGDAIVLAEQLLGGKGRVVVISDFISTEGLDIEVARKVLRSKGIIVDFVDVSSNVDNLGFTDVVVDKDKTKLYITNFGSEPKTITVKVAGQEISVSVQADSVEPLTIQTVPGVTKVEIVDKDDFDVDNTVYVSAPAKATIPVLLITNEPDSSLAKALRASPDVDLTIGEPPVLPAFNHEVIIMHNVNTNAILAGTVEQLRDALDEGSDLVINAQDYMGHIGYGTLLPVEVYSKQTRSTVVVDMVNEFTKDIDFGVAQEYMGCGLLGPAVSVAHASKDDSPLIAFKDHGKGKVFYFGIYDGDSDFAHTPSYPIFWDAVVHFLVEDEDLSLYNYKTGQMMVLPERQQVSVPSGSVTTRLLLMDEVGEYKVNNRDVAVNLANQGESRVERDFDIESESYSEYASEIIKKDEDFNVVPFLLSVIGLLLIVELIYLKVRGDV